VLSLPVAVRIFVFTGVTDMRRSFDGLAAMVEKELGQNPESGHLFLFFNRRHDRVKILFWQGDGLVLWYKRLEGSVFPTMRAASDKPEETPALEIRAGELAMLLDGVDPRTVVRRKRFYRVAAAREDSPAVCPPCMNHDQKNL
jgi:transposase